MSPRPSATDRLNAAARRLGRALRARAAGAGPRPGEPEPATEWERRADDRLRAIERQLSNQNRLLILTLVSIFAEVAYKVAGR
jgi:hypothetical protein